MQRLKRRWTGTSSDQVSGPLYPRFGQPGIGQRRRRHVSVSSRCFSQRLGTLVASGPKLPHSANLAPSSRQTKQGWPMHGDRASVRSFFCFLVFILTQTVLETRLSRDLPAFARVIDDAPRGAVSITNDAMTGYRLFYCARHPDVQRLEKSRSPHCFPGVLDARLPVFVRFCNLDRLCAQILVAIDETRFCFPLCTEHVGTIPFRIVSVPPPGSTRKCHSAASLGITRVCSPDRRSVARTVNRAQSHWANDVRAHARHPQGPDDPGRDRAVARVGSGQL